MTTSNETPETETTEEPKRDPEPIDAEFEPAQGPEPKAEKQGVGMATVAACSIGAALAGGAIGVIGSGSSTIDTAKFAPAEIRTDIEALNKAQEKSAEQIDKAWETLNITEARLEGQVEEVNAKLSALNEAETLLRTEMETLTIQLSSLIGPDPQSEAAPMNGDEETATSEGETDDAGVVAGATDAAPAPARSPLERLMARITYLEERLAGDDASPETNAQIRRVVTDLTERLDTLESARDEIARTLEQREQSITSLKTGLFTANQAIASVEESILALKEEGLPISAEDSPSKDELEALRTEIATLKSNITAGAAASSASSENSGAPSEAAAATDVQDGAATTGAAAVAAEEQNKAKQISDAALAMSRLVTQSARGKPFPTAWDELDAALPNNANIAAIKQISRRGAPRLGDLRDAFKPIRASLETSIQKQGRNDGWDWARKAFGDVVTVRRTDAETDTPEAVLARMADALDNADLNVAITEADKLSGIKSDDYETWLTDARARQTLNTNIEAIREEIFEQSAELSGRK